MMHYLLKQIKLFTPILLTLCLISSCKKNFSGIDPTNQPTDYYIKFKANGVLTEYKKDAAGNFNVYSASPPASYGTSIYGSKVENQTTKDAASLLLSSTTENKINRVYTSYSTSVSNHEKASLLSIGMFDSAGEFFMSWAQESVSVLPPGTLVNNTMVITAFSTAGIKGTFSGTLYNNNFSKRISITEGEFFVKTF